VVKIVVYDITGAKSGQGSGFFIGDGKIVTNAHVVQDAYSAEVHGSLGLYENVTILKEDEDIDLALLQVSATGEPRLRLAVARSRLRPGQRILAIGNPMGLDHTVSDGLISAVRGLPGEFQLVQISAPISPGSSGGPLLDMEGRVVGVTSAGISDGQNLNFAVGIETLQEFLSRNDSPRALEKAGEWVFWRAALKWVGNAFLWLIALVFGEGGFGWLVIIVLIMVITGIVAGLKWLWRVVSSPFRMRTAQGLHSPGDSVADNRLSASYDDDQGEQELRTAQADLFDDGADDVSEEFATARPSIRVEQDPRYPPGMGPNSNFPPEVVAGAARVVLKFAKAGTLKFAVLVERLVASIGQAAVDKIRPVLEAEWEKLRQSGEVKGMEPIQTADGGRVARAILPPARARYELPIPKD
jgi:hypothetical protein